MNIRLLLGLLCGLILGGCSSLPAPEPGGGVDPILSWDAVTTACDGVALTGPITYNIYGVSGTGPIPSEPSPDASPCGIIQLATGTPLNAAPVTTTTARVFVPDGVWTFATEAVLPSGARSGLSAPVTRTVTNRGSAPLNLRAQ